MIYIFENNHAEKTALRIIPIEDSKEICFEIETPLGSGKRSSFFIEEKEINELTGILYHIKKQFNEKSSK